MADHSTATPEATKATSTAQPPVQDVNVTAEVESERMVRAVGGGSPEVAPGMFAGALGQLGSSSQVGMLRGLQKSYGNNYVGRVIQAKLTVGQPGDMYEQEADRVANAVMLKSESSVSAITANSNLVHPKQSPRETPTVTPTLEARLDATRGVGEALPESVRSFMEPRFGIDFSGVRVHTGSEAGALNQELRAQAFTRQQDIYFGEGKYQPQTKEGQGLLAHELTHVIQQSHQLMPVIQRNPDPPNSSSASTTATPTDTTTAIPSTNIHLIPPEWIREPNRNDFLVAISNGRLFALPATGSIVVIQPPQQTTIPTEPLFTVPTVGKEGLIVVNVGGRMGFQIDAGGRPAVVFPSAMAAIYQALGVTSIRGVVITHIHDDHVQSFVALVRNQRIAPENIYYPEAFGVNSSAPGSTFTLGLQAIQADPNLRTLGHGSTASYRVIPTPSAGTFFHHSIREGQVTFDLYGLTRAFQDIAAARRTGRSQPMADTASLLTRVTHEPSGMRVLFLSDLRGSDLTLFRQAMGDAGYQEMLQGVRVIQGFQHHMGALESAADRTGLIDLITRTYLQTGSLNVVVQSQEQYAGRQFLNRSLMRALTDIGVNVHVAQNSQGSAVGTMTFNTEGQITHAGGGRTESQLGSTEMQGHVQRLLRLRQAEEVLTRYGRFVVEQHRHTDGVRQARQSLEQAMREYLETSITGVQTGARGRGQSSLTAAAQTQQSQILLRLRNSHQVEDYLTPNYMAAMTEINRIGPYREILEREMQLARQTGRLSEAGIEALWELEPEAARRLVASSSLPRRAQRQIIQQLPGQPIPVRTRAVAGFMLAIEAANLILQGVTTFENIQAQAFNEDVLKALNDIMWWQSKGVFPTMQGVNDRWWPRDNEWTSDPRRIQELLNNNDLNYLALTGIPDENWDRFTVWATTHLQNYRDWNSFITQSNAIKGEGQYIDELRWSYRKGQVVGVWSGHDITEEWEYSERLTNILRAAARHMTTTTEQQISRLASQPGETTIPDSSEGYHSQTVYRFFPQATGRKRFRQNLEERTLYTLYGQERRTGYRRESLFYTFARSMGTDRQGVPAGYIIVGGADYNTYIQIYNTENVQYQLGISSSGSTYSSRIQPNTLEVLLARVTDLEDVPS